MSDSEDTAAARHATPQLLLGKARAKIGETPYAVAIRVGKHDIVADEPVRGKGRSPSCSRT